MCLKIKELNHFLGLAAMRQFLLQLPTGKKELAQRFETIPAVATNQQVFEHCCMFEQLDILEGPSNAAAHDLVRLGREQAFTTQPNIARYRVVDRQIKLNTVLLPAPFGPMMV